jgi:hypothetical protein
VSAIFRAGCPKEQPAFLVAERKPGGAIAITCNSEDFHAKLHLTRIVHGARDAAKIIGCGYRKPPISCHR